MRHLVLSLAAIAVVSLAARTTLADHEPRGGGGYGGCYGYSGYSGGYRGPSSYGGYGYQPSYHRSSSYYRSSASHSSLSHSQAARRITAEYSRDRFSPHPRSNYRSPARYGYRGW